MNKTVARDATVRFNLPVFATRVAQNLNVTTRVDRRIANDGCHTRCAAQDERQRF